MHGWEGRYPPRIFARRLRHVENQKILDIRTRKPPGRSKRHFSSSLPQSLYLLYACCTFDGHRLHFEHADSISPRRQSNFCSVNPSPVLHSHSSAFLKPAFRSCTRIVAAALLLVLECGTKSFQTSPLTALLQEFSYEVWQTSSKSFRGQPS
ncbi:hypothetical protein L7F22_036339 [Adiantum nelumboides]|nr:hypothetical protein [Adiantum nelumboides]